MHALLDTCSLFLFIQMGRDRQEQWIRENSLPKRIKAGGPQGRGVPVVRVGYVTLAACTKESKPIQKKGNPPFV